MIRMESRPECRRRALSIKPASLESMNSGWGFKAKTLCQVSRRPAKLRPPIPAMADPISSLRSKCKLGLKLVKAKSVAVDVLVIERLDKVPTEN
jgi:hypothetical protein